VRAYQFEHVSMDRPTLEPSLDVDLEGEHVVEHVNIDIDNHVPDLAIEDLASDAGSSPGADAHANVNMGEGGHDGDVEMPPLLHADVLAAALQVDADAPPLHQPCQVHPEEEVNNPPAHPDLTRPLFDGANMTTDRFCLGMSKIKTDHNVSEAGMDAIYKFVGKGMLDGNVVPKSSYAAKKTLAATGLDYQCIDACPNHCILYRGDANANLTHCLECDHARYHPETTTAMQVISASFAIDVLVCVCMHMGEARLTFDPNHVDLSGSM